MALGEKIQICRKSKGVSQEEMASAIGVSRQALSKWECNTSIPDIDNIIALSNYFNVTTDYLLKDECSQDKVPLSTEINKQNGNILNILSTAIIAIGLVTSFAMANDGSSFFYWQFRSAALGIGIQILGICIFEILYYSKRYEIKNQYLFWSINTWFLSIMPIILCSGVLSRFLNRFKVLRYYFNILLFYLIFNLVITLIFLILSKLRKNSNRLVS